MTVMSAKRKVTITEEDDSLNREEDSPDIEGEAEWSDVDSNEAEGSDEDSGSEKESGNEEDGENINSGWADSIAKILKTNKPKKKKTLVLSKAKKLSDVKRTKTTLSSFQIETQEGDVKTEEIKTEEVTEDAEESSARRKKKEILSVRMKPDILQKDRERLLMKIATKGVVQLFNAVKTQQKDIKTKLQDAGPLEVRRDKVLKNIDKRAFLDVLMGEKSHAVGETVPSNNTGTKIKEDTSTWNVLRDDFMMGAKMKDWDKDLEEEDEEMEMETENNMESD